jgi:peptide/nickel transport system ATP-binding protein
MADLISIRDLRVQFYTYDGTVTALDGINLDIRSNETYGLVGETGCGKTVTALSILRLIPPPGVIEQGSISFNDSGDGMIELLTISEDEIRKIRGNKISMIFQEPSSALDPVYTIGDQISESILLHLRHELAERVLEHMHIPPGGFFKKITAPVTRPLELLVFRTIAENPETRLPDILMRFPIIRNILWRSRSEAVDMTVDLLKSVEMPDASRVTKQYPHELSGGMKQRSVIAMALACNPRLLIADEPTTALDVTIQAQILDLLRKLKDERNASILYITHDLSVAAEICDRIGVMYAGQICEEAGAAELYDNPMHPYTKALLAAVPGPGKHPHAIIGAIHDFAEEEGVCKFYPRCSVREKRCLSGLPESREVSPGHFVACRLC